MQSHREQPTRLLWPQDSLGKNTGVGRHFLLQDTCTIWCKNWILNSQARVHNPFRVLCREEVTLPLFPAQVPTVTAGCSSPGIISFSSVIAVARTPFFFVCLFCLLCCQLFHSCFTPYYRKRQQHCYYLLLFIITSGTWFYWNTTEQLASVVLSDHLVDGNHITSQDTQCIIYPTAYPVNNDFQRFSQRFLLFFYSQDHKWKSYPE